MSYKPRMRPGLALVALIACGTPPAEVGEVPLSKIVAGKATLRTDVVGEGTAHQATSTFVLVDARNEAAEGAWVSLDGELRDEAGAAVGALVSHAMWIPPGETRLFALIDSEQVARPTAKAARVRVRGALKMPPPLVRIEEIHEFPNHGEPVVNAYLVNDAELPATVSVVGAFYDASGTPMTRPFMAVRVGRKTDPRVTANCPDVAEKLVPQGSRCTIQLIGPRGAVRGTMFIGEAQYGE